MKRSALTGLLILTLLLVACGREEEAETTPSAVADYVPMISVTGEVLPATKATLSAQTGGQLTELLVTAGSQVEAGAVLARLDDRAARLGVQQAQAALATAEAQLVQVQAGVRDEEVAQAETAVKVAEAGLQLVWEGADDQQLIAARAELANAEAALKQAQAAYDPIKWMPGIGMRPESLQMEQATNAYDAAQARYQDLAEGPSAATIRQAQAQVAQAEASQELVQAGATAEAIAVAEAQVEAAQVALEQADLALAQTEIRATFAGVVGIIFMEAGEFIAPGQPFCIVGDLSTLHVETTDLSEIDVAQIEVGKKATITFDALPDETFTGTITHIAPMADPQSSGVNYTVQLAVAELDPIIRWGMTAFVDIETE